MNTIRDELRLYASAITLNRFLSRRTRRRIRRILGFILFFLCIAVSGFVLYDFAVSRTFSFRVLTDEARYVTAAFFFLLSPFLVLLAISFFFHTRYFRGQLGITNERLVETEGITLEVASMCSASIVDLTDGFLRSAHGIEVLDRLGISKGDTMTFLSESRTHYSCEELPLIPGTFLTPLHVGAYLYASDTAFKQFLFDHSITESLFVGANEWISRMRFRRKQSLRWWGRDALGRRQGIGRELSFGVAYELRRFMRNPGSVTAFSLPVHDGTYANEIIESIETILTRSRAANVVLVGESGMGVMDILIELGWRMQEGSSVASLTGKRLVVFDTVAFSATHNTKDAFEYAFLTLFGQAERAGNIVVVIEDFPAFAANAATFMVQVTDLLKQFLSSPNIQLVITANADSYHRALTQDGEFLRNFSPIIMEPVDTVSTIRVLEDAIGGLEHTNKVFFLFPSLVRVAESADQYIVDGVMPDKALSLLAEIVSLAAQDKTPIVTPAFVDTCVSKKTGIPLGPMRADEREMLLNLEDRLHERVIGQHDAIVVIASAMRRARAGIQDKERPLGSFLFLGSTGVGKTETAKALAAVFFGDEEKMIRFDMSEFSDDRALTRLIGDKDEPGVLASALRGQPFGVVLLDEFEKATPQVHDLFLQILDEGMFTDARGMRINARNTIVIATSNAGSGRISALIEEGKRPSDEHDAIIEAIIDDHVFKPELINRFDATVIFEMLSETHRTDIARIMLEELQERIRVRGYELIISDELLSAIVDQGHDPEFGARPMRRAIQDLIEESVARKIIEGALQPGAQIELTRADLTPRT